MTERSKWRRFWFSATGYAKRMEDQKKKRLSTEVKGRRANDAIVSAVVSSNNIMH